MHIQEHECGQGGDNRNKHGSPCCWKDLTVRSRWPVLVEVHLEHLYIL